MGKQAKVKKETVLKNPVRKESFWLKHPYLIICAAAFIVFIRTAGFDFVYVDDDSIILDNYDKISSLSDIPGAFTSQYGFKESTPYYRPVINLSFVLDCLISGKDPGWYHISNMIFHAAVVSLLFLMLLKLRIDKIVSLIVSLIFLVHPLLTNAVVWIPGRNDLIAGFFCILSFIYFIKFLSAETSVNLALHSLFYLLGIFSKEVVLVLPAACILYLILFERKKLNKIVLTKLVVVWFLPVVLSRALQGFFVRSIGNVTYGFSAFIDNLRVIPEVIFKVFVPVNISVLPTFSDTGTIAGSVILLALIILPLLIRDINRKKYYFGIFWFFLFLLPGLFIVYTNQAESFDYLDTRDYLPVMGLIISAGTVIPLIKVKDKFKGQIAGIALLILFSVLTFFQSSKYMNAEIFAKSAVESNPERPFFYQKLADYYFSEKDFAKAVVYLKETIKREPNSFFHYKNLALAYLSLRQPEDALTALEKAYNLNDNDPDVLKALIRINYELGRYRESLEYMDKVIGRGGKVDPGLYESVKEKVNRNSDGGRN